MKKSTKGALLSAFACPGVGHFSLGLNRRGWFFLILTVICLGLLLGMIWQVSMSVAMDIAEGSISMNPLDVREAINERMVEQSTGRTKLAIGTLVVCWVVALIDAIREGRKQDRKIAQ